MLLIHNKRVNWETHQIRIPGATATDKRIGESRSHPATWRDDEHH
jgi:hypothetical protein